jgi:hypothetical protein
MKELQYIFFSSRVQLEFKTTTFNSIRLPGEDLNVLHLEG